MSGAGSSGYYSYPHREVDSCIAFVKETTLTNVDETELALVHVQYALKVEFEDNQVVVTNNGNIVGYVEIPQQKFLIDCIKAGTAYIAIVTNIDSNVCRVKIRAGQFQY